MNTSLQQKPAHCDTMQNLVWMDGCTTLAKFSSGHEVVGLEARNKNEFLEDGGKCWLGKSHVEQGCIKRASIPKTSRKEAAKK